MSELDVAIHLVHGALPLVAWRDVPKTNKEVKYYYAEGRTYLLKFLDGTIHIGVGSSPYEVLTKLALAQKAYGVRAPHEQKETVLTNSKERMTENA